MGAWLHAEEYLSRATTRGAASGARVVTTLPGARSSPGDCRWVLAVPQGHIAADPRKMGAGRDRQNPDVSHRAARDLIVKIARAARYDGSSLSIDTSDNFLARMEVRNGSDGLHLDPQIFEILGFSGFRPHNNVTLSKSTTAGGPIFGKATKVAKTKS